MVPTVCNLCKGLHDLLRFGISDIHDLDMKEGRAKLIRKATERGKEVTEKGMNASWR